MPPNLPSRSPRVSAKSLFLPLTITHKFGGNIAVVESLEVITRKAGQNEGSSWENGSFSGIELVFGLEDVGCTRKLDSIIMVIPITSKELPFTGC